MTNPASTDNLAPSRICPEDGGLPTWFRADKLTKYEARREIANECMMPCRDFSVKRAWMRQIEPDEADLYGVSRFMAEEGWWTICERNEPGAFAAWEVDEA